MSPTPFVLCADDFALSAGISEAICHLIEDGRIAATSCMTVCVGWPEQATWLKPLQDRADIGLHLTLTDLAPLGPMPSLAPDGLLPPLPVLMRRAMLRRIDGGEVAAEVARQLDAFELAFGRPPDFVDGHQHVHQLPIVRQAVVTALLDLLHGGAYVRSCWESPLAIARVNVAVPKALLIAGLGYPLRRRIDATGLPANRHFRGVYDFSDRIPYPKLFEAFLRDLPPRTLMMCHPGMPDAALRKFDPIADQRQVEYDFLRSDGFPDTLGRRAARIARFERLDRNDRDQLSLAL